MAVPLAEFIAVPIALPLSMAINLAMIMAWLHLLAVRVICL